jgi:hypothetical protein
MAKFYDKKTILQKIEGTEGTDSAPVVGADAILTRDYAPNVLESDTRTRNLDLQWFGARPQTLAAMRRGATFNIDMAGSGTAVGIPSWMKMNRIAGFDAGVVNGIISVTQSPISASVPSASHWAYIDNLLLKAVGCRASMGIRIEDDEFPFFTYTLLGRAPTTLAEEATPGTPTLTAWKDPVLANSANTTFALDGYALPLRRLELDANADLALRSLIGPQDRVNWRNRALGGRILAELPDLSAKDYFQKIPTGATMIMALVHGTTTGNIVEVNAPKVQITGIDIPEEQGFAMLAMDVILLPNAGNDEITFLSR